MDIHSVAVTFHTSKLRESVNFYTRCFDAQITFDSAWYIVVSIGSASNGLATLSFQYDKMLKRKLFAGGLTINMRTEDVDACYSQLKGKGVLFFEDIVDHEWGDRAFSVLDPIGNIVYVYSDRELANTSKATQEVVL